MPAQQAELTLLDQGTCHGHSL